MVFEELTRNDLDEIMELQPEGWTEIRSKFRFYIENNFCIPKKVVIDNRIVGLGCSVLFEKSAWLAHIIVHPKYRNRGIGRKIVDDLLADIKIYSTINSVLLIATQMGEPVYSKAGFRIVSDYQFFYRKKPWNKVPFSKNIFLYKKGYYDQLIELDKEISGENREPLIRQYLADAIVYQENEELKGYYLPSLGDGIINARNHIAGIELMKFKYAQVDKAVLPAENTTGIKFLKQNGFGEPVVEGKRMVLGEDINWKPEKFFSRIGGNYG